MSEQKPDTALSNEEIIASLKAQLSAEPQRRSLFRRTGCGILLLLWFLFLMTPCLLFFLFTQGEVRLPHGNVPEPQEHPLLLLSLISDADFRGLMIMNSTIRSQPDDNAVCVQTNVNYLLWQGTGDPATYCDCYMREGAATDWLFSRRVIGACPAADR